MQFNSTNIDSDKIRMPFNLAMTVAYNESDTTFGLLHTSSDLSVFFDAINGSYKNDSSLLVE